jgi:hypothetical protein
MYDRTVNFSVLVVVAIALFADHYPEWAIAFACAGVAAACASTWVYFRRRFDVIAGRGEPDEPAVVPTATTGPTP